MLSRPPRPTARKPRAGQANSAAAGWDMSLLRKSIQIVTATESWWPVTTVVNPEATNASCLYRETLVFWDTSLSRKKIQIGAGRDTDLHRADKPPADQPRPPRPVRLYIIGIMRNGLWGSWAGGQGACVDSCKALPVPITRPLEADAVRARNAKREVSRRTVKVHARHFGSRAG